MTVLASQGDPPLAATTEPAGSGEFERRLVAAAQAGDRAAMAGVYERFAPMVNAVVLAHAGRDEAEDLVQEVFVRAMSRIKTLRDGAAIGPWLAAIARNLAADAGRAKGHSGRLRLAATEVARSESPAPEPDVEVVLRAIRALPEAYRESMSLRLVERMTGPQIAERLGLTHGSVRVNLCRGMKLLRAALAGRPGMDGER